MLGFVVFGCWLSFWGSLVVACCSLFLCSLFVDCVFCWLRFVGCCWCIVCCWCVDCLLLVVRCVAVVGCGLVLCRLAVCTLLVGCGS